MKKYRHLYLGKDAYFLDESYYEDLIEDCVKFCKISYAGKNEENIVTSYDLDDTGILNIVLQAVLDTSVIRSLLLGGYTERKKE